MEGEIIKPKCNKCGADMEKQDRIDGIYLVCTKCEYEEFVKKVDWSTLQDKRQLKNPFR